MGSILQAIRSWFTRERAAASVPTRGFDIDAPLIRLSRHPGDSISWRTAFGGILIVGATGSGKTSGSGAALAKAFLRAGAGGLVLTTKIGECDQWRQWAKETGRSNDLIVFAPNQPYRINVLAEEARRESLGGGITENIVELFMQQIENAEDGNSSASKEPYWDRAVKSLLRCAIETIILAGEELSVLNITKVIQSAPTTSKQVKDPAFRVTSYCATCMDEADRRTKGTNRRADYEANHRYWKGEHFSADPKTRSNVLSSYNTMADIMSRGILNELLASQTNVLPEASLDGKIIIIDMPLKAYHGTGLLCQVTWKFIWQKAMERRDVRMNPRPVFLFVDECQNFTNRRGDIEYQATARSSHCATVYLTQSVSALYSKLGDRAAADALLANFATKIFHCQCEPASLNFCEEVFGKSWQTHVSTSHQPQAKSNDYRSPAPSKPQVSSNISRSLDSNILGSTLTTLRTGGPIHHYLVDAVIFSAGRVWAATGKNFIKTSFRQG